MGDDCKAQILTVLTNRFQVFPKTSIPITPPFSPGACAAFSRMVGEYRTTIYERCNVRSHDLCTFRNGKEREFVYGGYCIYNSFHLLNEIHSSI